MKQHNMNLRQLSQTQPESVEGVVLGIRFQNSDTGYAVIFLQVDQVMENVCVTGVLPGIHPEARGTFFGEWVHNPKYGLQFAATRWEELLPVTLKGIENYLSCGLIRGIGPKMAKRIVAKFGIDTIEIIEADPTRLLEVPGIGKAKLKRVLESWGEFLHIKKLMLFLQEHDVTPGLAVKIYNTYQERSISILQANPYVITEDIYGVGFKTADTLALKLGYAEDDPRRCAYGLQYALLALAGEGHAYAMEEQLLRTAAGLLRVDEAVLSQVLGDQLEAEKLIRDDERIYLPMYYRSEVGVAEKLFELCNHSSGEDLSHTISVEQLQEQSGIVYDDVQVDAIRTALQSKVLVLTGGPGTGKTTTTQGIIQAMESAHLRVLLAAPTGRAAKRMSESTGRPASTIHRLLGFGGGNNTQFNAENPLEGDVLLVDECSMIDLLLMYQLLKAVPLTMRMILVGDTEQLPSIGAGNVLLDIIASGCIPVIRLTRIFRQAQSSRIILGAHAINAGRLPDLTNGKDSDFFFLPQADNEQLALDMVDLLVRRLPAYYGYKPDQMQVLTPMRKGVIGTENLNQLLQQALNPDSQSIASGAMEYRVHDRVMQIRNNYNKDVYNGDIGYIRSVDPEEQKLTVEFEGKSVLYERRELDELQLSYACTIHKSQGSEFPVVILPISCLHYIMLQRNLIYTGITRAKKICILVGTTEALRMAIANNKVPLRNSRLKDRLLQCFQSKAGMRRRER